MAVGSTRVYVRPNGAFNWPNYFAALREGRSFVTNGPMVQLTVDGMLPGDVPKFVRRYLRFHDDAAAAVARFAADVRSGDFPGDAETYS